MFKGDDFVRKHVVNKHPDRVEEYKRRSTLLNAYLKDAFKLTFADMQETTSSGSAQGGPRKPGSSDDRRGITTTMGGYHSGGGGLPPPPPQFMAPLVNVPSVFRNSLIHSNRRAHQAARSARPHPYGGGGNNGGQRRPSRDEGYVCCWLVCWLVGWANGDPGI